MLKGRAKEVKKCWKVTTVKGWGNKIAQCARFSLLGGVVRAAAGQITSFTLRVLLDKTFQVSSWDPRHTFYTFNLKTALHDRTCSPFSTLAQETAHKNNIEASIFSITSMMVGLKLKSIKRNMGSRHKVKEEENQVCRLYVDNKVITRIRRNNFTFTLHWNIRACM